MERDKLATGALRLVAGRLASSGLPWCVMAGAAATCYGVQRAITDIDILICAEEEERLLALFPEGQRKAGQNSLDIGPAELWWGTLPLRGGERFYDFISNAELIRRITHRSMLGLIVPVMSPEDVILMKAILQRGPERKKHDLEDIQAMLQTMGKQLDIGYLQERARACGALERVEPCLKSLGASWIAPSSEQARDAD